MRIALVTREYPPETDWGGIGRFYASFAVALRQAGHEVEVFTQGLTHDRMEERDGILIHRVVPRQWVAGRRVGGDLAGMGVRHLGVFALSLAAAMAARVELRRKAKPFDVVEGHEHLGINALVNAFGGRHFAAVTRYHTAYHSLVHRRLVDWPASSLIRRLEARSLRGAHTRISASSFIDEMTRADFPDTPPCDVVIPLLNGDPPAAVAPPIGEREKLMIFAGRLVLGHKRPHLAAEAFARLAAEFPDWRIEFAGMDMAGDGQGSSWAMCERILAPFAGRFHYHGVLDWEGVQQLYRRARAVLIPSQFESFGLVALEAMANGAVPFVSDGTALPEVAGEGGVVIRNGSLDDLAAKLAAFLRDERQQEELSQAASRRAREEFATTHIVERNIELFERLARARRAGR